MYFKNILLKKLSLVPGLVDRLANESTPSGEIEEIQDKLIKAKQEMNATASQFVAHLLVKSALEPASNNVPQINQRRALK